MHSLIGRMKCPWPIGERVSVLTDDGATLTYDVYQPLDVHLSGGTVLAIYQLLAMFPVLTLLNLFKQRTSLWYYVLVFATQVNLSTFAHLYIMHKGKATDV